MIRQRTSDIQETLESLKSGTSSTDKQKSLTTLSVVSSNSDSDENQTNSDKTISGEQKSLNRNDSVESDSLAGCENLNEEKPPATTVSSTSMESKEDELVYLVTNILFTILWHGIENNGGDSWKERGQVIACINLLGLNNELYCSHLTLRLKILELGTQSVLIDLSETGAQLMHQENAAQWLRMIYDLVVLDPNEDEMKKCSTRLMDGVLAIMDALIVFQQAASDDWTEMSRLCLGLLMKCSHHPNPEIVAMATARLHTILQIRTSQDPQELSYLMYSINKALSTAIEGEKQNFPHLD